MVGAEPADFERIKPVLQAFCENVFHVGKPGDGHVLKLVNNMLAMTTAASIAEAAAVAAKSGLSLRKLHEVVSAGGVNSGIFQMMFGRMLEGDLGGLKFAIANAQKDLRYYTHLAESLPVPSFVAEAAHQSFVQAANLGFGDKFIASLFEAQERTARSASSTTQGDNHERSPQASQDRRPRRGPLRRRAVLRAVEDEPRLGAERAEEAARARPDDGRERPVRRLGRRWSGSAP